MCSCVHAFIHACAVVALTQWLSSRRGHIHGFMSKWVCCVQVADKGPIGLAQHPHRNLVATWADEGALKLWKA
jgi:hypothetical protein